MFRDHPDENVRREWFTPGKYSEAMWLIGKAARRSFCKALEDSLRSQKLYEYGNLYKRIMKKLKLYCAVLYLLFTQHFLCNRCFNFYRKKVLSLNCYFKVPIELHRHKYFRATPVLCLISLGTPSKASHCLFRDWHLTSPSLPHAEPPIIFGGSSEANTSEANAEIILMYHSVLLAISNSQLNLRPQSIESIIKN